VRPVLAAAVLGAGGGLRSFAPPAVLAARGGGPFAGPARFIAFGAAAGELIADKQPDMGSRWAPRGLSLRLGFSRWRVTSWRVQRARSSPRPPR
jgi:hypothetical protein